MRINNMMYNNMMLMNNMKILSNNYSKNIERLSSGKRINKAADSPSEILRLSRLESQYRGNKVAQTNIKQGMSLLDTMDSALTNIKDIGMKIKELDVQYNNGILSNDEKDIIKQQTQELYKEINHILENTTYNGMKVFGEEKVTIQTGPNQNDKYDINKPHLDLDKYIKNDNSTMIRSLMSDFNSKASNNVVPNPHDDIYLKFEDVKIVEEYKDLNNYITIYENGWTVSTPVENDIKGWSQIYKDGELVVEGVFEDGKLNGWSKIYKDGELIREGVYKNNRLNGWGEVVFSDGTRFNGVWENGLKKGWGTLYDKDGNILEERYWDDSPSGDIGGGNGDGSINPPNPEGGDGSGNDGDGNGNINPPESGGNENINPPETNDGININIDDLIKDVSSLQSMVGIQYNILEYRLENQKNMEIINTKTYNDIADVDTAKELLESVKNQMLLDVNINLFHKNLESHKEYIIELLK